MNAREAVVVGVLDRHGTPDPAHVARGAQAFGGSAQTLVSGALAIAWVGIEPPAREGAALALVDGVLDVDPAQEPGSPPPAEAEAPGAVLRAWRRGERALLDAIRGDFALVLWDGQRGALVRDHMGARTWFVHDDGARLTFASEVTPLLAALPARPRPDAEAVAHWLGISGMPGVKTLYDGIERVPAGNLRPLDPGRPLPSRRWWELRYRKPERMDAQEAAARIRTVLDQAVARRSRDGQGDATALQLSGGLDSSTVGGVAAAALPAPTRPRRSYSVVFPDHPTVDEESLIVEVADRIGVASTRLEVRSGSVLQGALPYIERWQLPPVSPNLFFWYPMLDRAQADGTRVLLDGEGGDEIFGASVMLIADTLLRSGPRAAADLVRRLPGGRPDMGREVTTPFLKLYGLRPLAPAWVHTMARRVRPAARYVQPWVLPQTAKAFTRSGHQSEWKRHDGPRWWAHLVESTTCGMGVALGYDHGRRRAATANIMPRHPIADPDVIHTILSIPPDLTFDARFSRPLVRQAVEGLIPDSVRLRPDKSTFDAIFHDSLAGADRPLACGLLGASDARLGEYVDLAGMRLALLEGEPPAGRERSHWALQVWRLLTLEAWLLVQEDPRLARAKAERFGLPEPDVRFAGAPAVT